MRTMHDLYVTEHGDEMPMGQLAVLGEVRRRLVDGLKFLERQSVPAATVQDYVVSLVDAYASGIVDDCEWDEG